jgi:hypothetical protein
MWGLTDNIWVLVAFEHRGRVQILSRAAEIPDRKKINVANLRKTTLSGNFRFRSGGFTTGGNSNDRSTQ